MPDRKTSDDDFEIKSKIYTFNLRLVLKHISRPQDVFLRNFLFALLDPLTVQPFAVGLQVLNVSRD